MKRGFITILVAMAWLLTSGILAYFWLGNPDLFPQFPRFIWEWADSFYASRNAEEVAELDFIVFFSMSGIFVFLVCAIAYSFWRRFRSTR